MGYHGDSSNCLDGVDVYFDWPGRTDPENSLTKRWKSALDSHLGYKWTWLNRGKAKLYIDTVVDPLFADQKFAIDYDMPLDY